MKNISQNLTYVYELFLFLFHGILFFCFFFFFLFSNLTEGVANSARDAGSSRTYNKRGVHRQRRILQGDERRMVR